MREIFFKICGTVLILNVMLLILPDGKYEKYVKFTAGLIVILSVAGSLFDMSIDHKILNFDKEAFLTDTKETEQKLFENITAETLEECIFKELGFYVDVEMDLKDNNIQKIEVVGVNDKKELVEETIIRYCDIKRDRLVIK